MEHIIDNRYKCILVALGVLAIAAFRGDGPEGAEQIASVSQASIAAQSEWQSAALVRGADANALQESFDEITMTPFGAAVLKHKNVHLISGKGVKGSKAIRVDYRGNSRAAKGSSSITSFHGPCNTL